MQRIPPESDPVAIQRIPPESDPVAIQRIPARIRSRRDPFLFELEISAVPSPASGRGVLHVDVIRANGQYLIEDSADLAGQLVEGCCVFISEEHDFYECHGF